MFKFRQAAMASLAATVMLLPVEAFSLDAAGVLRQASRAMGATGLHSLRYVGSGTAASSGQALKPGSSRPMRKLSRYVRSINYESASLSEEATEQPAGGGAPSTNGAQSERPGSTFVSGPYAWNMAGAAAIPALPAASERVHELWITPHGVIKAAIRNHATLEWKKQGGRSLAAVSFAEPGRFKATAYINEKFLVEKVESRLPAQGKGETMVVTNYSEYQSFGPIMFPMQIRQSAGGRLVLDVTVRETQPNTPINITAPESLRTPR